MSAGKLETAEARKEALSFLESTNICFILSVFFQNSLFVFKIIMAYTALSLSILD